MTQPFERLLHTAAADQACGDALAGLAKIARALGAWPDTQHAQSITELGDILATRADEHRTDRMRLRAAIGLRPHLLLTFYAADHTVIATSRLVPPADTSIVPAGAQWVQVKDVE